MAKRMANKMLKKYNITPETIKNTPTKFQKFMDKFIYIVAI